MSVSVLVPFIRGAMRPLRDEGGGRVRERRRGGGGGKKEREGRGEGAN